MVMTGVEPKTNYLDLVSDISLRYDFEFFKILLSFCPLQLLKSIVRLGLRSGRNVEQRSFLGNGRGKTGMAWNQISAVLCEEYLHEGVHPACRSCWVWCLPHWQLLCVESIITDWLIFFCIRIVARLFNVSFHALLVFSCVDIRILLSRVVATSLTLGTQSVIVWLSRNGVETRVHCLALQLSHRCRGDSDSSEDPHQLWLRFFITRAALYIPWWSK
jgi:hypothetical protein